MIHHRATTIGFHDDNGTVCDNNDHKNVGVRCVPDLLFYLYSDYKEQEHESARQKAPLFLTWQDVGTTTCPVLENHGINTKAM